MTITARWVEDPNAPTATWHLDVTDQKSGGSDTVAMVVRGDNRYLWTARSPVSDASGSADSRDEACAEAATAARKPFEAFVSALEQVERP
jgi:hypothetical protein